MSFGDLWEAGARRGGRLFEVTLANVGLVVLIIGVVVSVVTPLLKTAHVFELSPPITPIFEPLLTELGYALLIAAIIILTTERHSRIEFNRLIQGQLSAVDKNIAEGLARVFKSIELLHFIDKINRSPQAEIKSISRKIYGRYVDGLEAIEGGFQVDDLNWALESNEIFYDVLYKSDSFHKCEVRITHTGSIDTWLNVVKAGVTLDRQQKCILDNYVSITRIFVGKNELSESLSGDFRLDCRVF